MERMASPFLLCLLGQVVSSALSGTTVILPVGILRGLEEVSTEGRTFASFMRIPYARPPVGPRRFQDPEPAEGWQGIYDATAMPDMCPQVLLTQFLMPERKPRIHGNEDCLHLNVFTRWANDVDAKMPVMVYIHGGGYSSGSSLEYPPHVVMNEDVLLVVINYRLGILGFLSTEDDVIPGNFGLKDQTLALSWVNQHISHFGGDPDKVTIFGESAGAASVHLQTMIPGAKGLFSRAILQSGSALSPWAIGGSHKQVAHMIASHFDCLTDLGSEEILSCLQGLSANALILASALTIKFIAFPVLFGPYVDGKFIPDTPQRLMEMNKTHVVDMITGITKDDGGIFTHVMFANEGLVESFNANFDDVASYSLEIRDTEEESIRTATFLYKSFLGHKTIDSSSVDSLTKLYTERFFSVPHDATAAYSIRNSARTRNTYMYEFDYQGGKSLVKMLNNDFGQDWVVHLDDMFYLFSGGLLFTANETEENREMSRLMTRMWANFAREGTPTPGDALGFTWQPASLDSFKHLSIKRRPSMVDDSRADVRRFWDEVGLKGSVVIDVEKVKQMDGWKEATGHFKTEL